MTTLDSLPVPDPGWAYFFDIDGTLVRIAERPGAVRATRGLQRLVDSLRTSSGGAVALITGRAVADVDRIFHGRRHVVAGQHGAERRTAAGGAWRRPQPDVQLNAIRQTLANAVARHPGLMLEDKGACLALHYRKAPALASYAHRLARTSVTSLGSAYCIQPAKRVVEIRRADLDKGTAIREFMKEKPFRGRTPVFLGDDATDEPGFAAVNRLGGHSIKIGPGPTAARWRLPDVAAVRCWLRGGHPAPRAVR